MIKTSAGGSRPGPVSSSKDSAVTDQPQNPLDPAGGPGDGGAVPPVPPSNVPPHSPDAAPPPPPTPPMGSVQPQPPAYNPPPGPGAVPPPAAASGAVNADIGAAFSWAGGKFGKYALIFIGLAAVVFAIRLIQALVNSALVNALNGDCANTIIVNGQNVTTTGACAASLATTITAGLITAIIFGVLAWIATIGVYRAALKTTLGETPGFHNITTGENLGKYIVVAIVYGLAIGIGIVLCIIPGIIVAFLFQLAPFYALDKGQSVGEAFGNSYRATTQNFGPAILMTLINIIAAFVGGILFGLLTLVALPFAALFTAHMYRQFNREQIAA
jgi:uncharacterized membrane protein